MIQFQVAYHRLLRNISGKPRKPDAYGVSKNLNNLLRNAAGRCAIENYHMAVIRDRKSGKVLYMLKRHQGSISIERP